MWQLGCWVLFTWFISSELESELWLLSAEWLIDLAAPVFLHVQETEDIVEL